MKKSISFWQFVGYVFTGVAGTLLHFLYDWTGSSFIALFSAVNESIWEHMKLLFFPMFVFAIIQSRYFAKYYPDFWASKLIGILVGLIVIPVIYYTYTGALGVSSDWFNILIFFIAAAFSYIIEKKLINSEKHFRISPTAAIGIICLIALLFIVFTFSPPKIPLFRDPLTMLYGLV